MTENTGFRSGFAALVGRPNVGKSTLLNALLGEKVSIVSSHAQTTRNKITGVWNGDNAQVVFLDTGCISFHLERRCRMKEAQVILNRLLDKFENSKHLSEPNTSRRPDPNIHWTGGRKAKSGQRQ